MSKTEKHPAAPGEDAPPRDEDFLQRWSRRKAEAAQAPAQVDSSTPEDASQPEAYQPTDADMPPLESLDGDSDYSGFLSPKVSEELRRLALRKLFHSAKFNVTDGLNDYADDYSKMEPLGDIVTADMRFHMERMKERMARLAQEEGAEERPRDTMPAEAEGQAHDGDAVDSESAAAADAACQDDEEHNG